MPVVRTTVSLLSILAIAAAPVLVPAAAAAHPVGCSDPVVLPDLGFGADALATNGQVTVGNLIGGDGQPHAATWSRGAVRLVPMPGFQRSTALDVSAHGLVVGQGVMPASGRVGWAYDGRRLTILQVPAGWSSASARRVDPHGRIAGSAVGKDGVTHALLWLDRDAKPVVLPEAPGTSGAIAEGFGRGGLVTGAVDSADDQAVAAAVWRPKHGRLQVQELAGVGGPAEAYDATSWLLVAGQGWTGNATDTTRQSHVVVWQHGHPRDLGALPGDDDAGALAVAANGLVVGTSASDLRPTDTGLSRGFVWRGHGPLVALPLPATDAGGSAARGAAEGVVVGSVYATLTVYGQAAQWRCVD